MMHPCTPCTQNHGKMGAPREKIEAEFEKIEHLFGKIQPIFFCTEPPCNRKGPPHAGTDLSDDEKMSNHIKTEQDEHKKEYFQQKRGAGGDKRGFHTPRNAHFVLYLPGTRPAAVGRQLYAQAVWELKQGAPY